MFQHGFRQMESNDPGEDRLSVKVNDVIAAWSVIDGHGGTAAWFFYMIIPSF